MPAIPVSHTAVVDKPWDGPGAVAKIPNDAGASVLRKEYAYQVPGVDPDTKAAYKLEHHEVENGTPGPANVNGVRNAMSRIPQLKPPLSAADETAVKAHLQAHLDDFQKANALAVVGEEGPELIAMPDSGVRALFGDGLELRDAEEPGTLGTLVGFLARFLEWAEIDSAVEGHFMERVMPGAFKKTFAEGLGRIRCIFHHGLDPAVGLRVLGPIRVLEEQGSDGAWAEVPLLDTSYNRDLEPGIRANLYGMSFRFKALRQNKVRNPRPSAHNPNGIPERSLTELFVPEFGPTPFQAYAGAQAGMRSITDETVAERLAAHDRDRLLAYFDQRATPRLVVAVPKDLVDAENDDVECTYCHEMNADDAVYCDQCGKKLANPGGAPYSAAPDETVKCPDCGKMNEEDAKYCDQCGESLTEDEGAAAHGPGVVVSIHGKPRETTRHDVAVSGLGATRVVTERLYERSVMFAAETPWLMEPQHLAVVLAILQERASGDWPSKEEIQARLGMRATAEPGPDEPKSPTAVIPLSGPIVPRGGMFSDVSGMTSIEGLTKTFRAAMADDDITTVVFDVDSPGGSAEMVPELATEIMAARGQKPMIAVANTLMASGAYWLASMADEIVASPSAKVGSIGVYSSHQDLTAQNKQLGKRVTIVTSGGSPYKTEFSPFVKLSEDAEAEMQRRVDAIYEDFVAAVASGRDTDTEDVNDNYGQGRVLDAKDALAAGMVDRIATFDSVLAQLEEAAPAPASVGAESDDTVVSHPAPARRGEIDPVTLRPKEAPSWRL